MDFQSKRVLFVALECNVYEDVIFRTQVLGLARWLARHGSQCLILHHSTDGKSKNITEEPNVWVHECKVPKRKVPIFLCSTEFERLLNAESAVITKFQPTHIYVRNYLTCLAVKRCAHELKAKIVYSVRGAVVEEASDGCSLLKRLFISRYVSWAYHRALQACDHLNTVSYRLAARLKKECQKDASVLPCCTDTTSTSIDVNTDVEGHAKKTLVYSGGLYSWQCADEILFLMKQIKAYDSNINIRILTQDQKLLRDKCCKIGFLPDKWVGKACRQEEVAQELACADVGIILRKDTVINNVASPIKLGEYLSAGLGVLMSPWIGDVGRLLKDAPFAYFYDGKNRIERIARFITEMNSEKRFAALSFAKKYYTYDGNSSAVEQMFS